MLVFSSYLVRIATLVALAATVDSALAQTEVVSPNSQVQDFEFHKSVDPLTDTVKFLNSTKKEEVNRFVTWAFPLFKAKAEDVLPYVKNAVEREGGRAATIALLTEEPDPCAKCGPRPCNCDSNPKPKPSPPPLPSAFEHFSEEAFACDPATGGIRPPTNDSSAHAISPYRSRALRAAAEASLLMTPSSVAGEEHLFDRGLRTASRPVAEEHALAGLTFADVLETTIGLLIERSRATNKSYLIEMAIDKDAKPNGFIQVVCPEFQIPYIYQLVQQLDRPTLKPPTPVSKEYTIVRDKDGNERIEMKEKPSEGAGAAYFKSIRIKHRRASEIARVLRGNNSPIPGAETVFPIVDDVFSDEQTNTITVRATQRENIVRALAAIEYYDVPIPQVEISVTVCEFQSTDESKIGLEWDAWKRALGGSFVLNYGQVLSRGPKLDSAKIFDDIHSPFTGAAGVLAIDATVLSEFINYMEEKGCLNVSSRTTLTAMNGKEATFSNMVPSPYLTYGSLTTVGNVPIFTRSASSKAPAFGGFSKVDNPTTPGFPVISNIATAEGTILPLQPLQLSNEGVSVTILPSISSETMELDISAIVTSPFQPPTLGAPVLTTRNLKNVVSLRDGQCFKLCSYERIESIDNERGVSGLNRIPIIRNAFVKQSNACVMKKAIVFLAPYERSQETLMAPAMDICATSNIQLRASIPAVPGELDKVEEVYTSTTWDNSHNAQGHDLPIIEPLPPPPPAIYPVAEPESIFVAPVSTVPVAAQPPPPPPQQSFWRRAFAFRKPHSHAPHQ